jgi:hypothetical protein
MTYDQVKELYQLVLHIILDDSRIACPLHGTHLREHLGWRGEYTIKFLFYTF